MNIGGVPSNGVFKWIMRASAFGPYSACVHLASISDIIYVMNISRPSLFFYFRVLLSFKYLRINEEGLGMKLEYWGEPEQAPH